MRFRRYTERIPRPIGTAHDEINACHTPRKGRTSRPLPGPILEGARVSNAAAHICAAAAGFFCYTHTGRYPEYLYSYRYL